MNVLICALAFLNIIKTSEFKTELYYTKPLCVICETKWEEEEEEEEEEWIKHFLDNGMVLVQVIGLQDGSYEEKYSFIIFRNARMYLFYFDLDTKHETLRIQYYERNTWNYP